MERLITDNTWWGCLCGGANRMKYMYVGHPTAMAWRAHPLYNFNDTQIDNRVYFNKLSAFDPTRQRAPMMSQDKVR